MDNWSHNLEAVSDFRTWRNHLAGTSKCNQQLCCGPCILCWAKYIWLCQVDLRCINARNLAYRKRLHRWRITAISANMGNAKKWLLYRNRYTCRLIQAVRSTGRKPSSFLLIMCIIDLTMYITVTWGDHHATKTTFVYQNLGLLFALFTINFMCNDGR